MLHQNVSDVVKAMTTVINDESTPPPVKDWLVGLSERLMESAVPDARLVKGGPLPASIGAMADEYSYVRGARLRMDRETREVHDRETEIYNIIMSALDESADTGGSGQYYRVQRIEKDRPRVGDWAEVWQHIQKTGEFDLVQRRLNDKAIMERWEAGNQVPGVAVEKIPTLSFRKVD